VYNLRLPRQRIIDNKKHSSGRGPFGFQRGFFGSIKLVFLAK